MTVLVVNIIFFCSGYLCNVLAALDQQPTPALSSLEKLLKAPDRQMQVNPLSTCIMGESIVVSFDG